MSETDFKIHDTISIASVLKGESCKDLFVDMGWWCDIPHVNSLLCKTLKEKGAKGVLVGNYADYWVQTVPLLVGLNDFQIVVRCFPMSEVGGQKEASQK